MFVFWFIRHLYIFFTFFFNHHTLPTTSYHLPHESKFCFYFWPQSCIPAKYKWFNKAAENGLSVISYYTSYLLSWVIFSDEDLQTRCIFWRICECQWIMSVSYVCIQNNFEGSFQLSWFYFRCLSYYKTGYTQLKRLLKLKINSIITYLTSTMNVGEQTQCSVMQARTWGYKESQAVRACALFTCCFCL